MRYNSEKTGGKSGCLMGTRMELKQKSDIPKTATGIEGFDTITGGGLPAGRITLLTGRSGTGKTIFSMEFLVRGILAYGEPGAFLSFEEKEEDLSANFRSLGMDLEKLTDSGSLAIDTIEVTPAVSTEAGESDLTGLLARLEQATDSVNARRVVLDSLPALFQGFSNTAAVRAALLRLFAWLRERNITAIATAQSDTEFSRYAFARSLADCIVVLSMRMKERISTRYLQVA